MKPRNGFTLIELIVTMAIVGILSAVAYPSYVQYVVKSKRKAAQSFMLMVANTQEKYVLDRRQYAYDPGAVATLGLTTPPEVSPHYTITVTGSNFAYTITATPIGTQLSGDARYGNCVNLTLNQTGLKGVSGTGSVATCW